MWRHLAAAAQCQQCGGGISAGGASQRWQLPRWRLASQPRGVSLSGWLTNAASLKGKRRLWRRLAARHGGSHNESQISLAPRRRPAQSSGGGYRPSINLSKHLAGWLASVASAAVIGLKWHRKYGGGRSWLAAAGSSAVGASASATEKLWLKAKTAA